MFVTFIKRFLFIEKTIFFTDDTFFLCMNVDELDKLSASDYN